jgi:demethylmenaquinone methyltransferase/2-methoxy-6-polyprenyl-1,4-benzoquinol methylase
MRQKDWLFHHVAPFYDFLIRKPQDDRLRDLLDLPANGVMLDLGGGTGRVSTRFSNRTAHVLVCDINRSMLKQARKKRRLLPLQADSEALPFPADSVDGILVVDALHHFSKPERSIQEMMRVLKPQGRLLIEEQDIERAPIKLVQFLERRVGLHSRFLSLHQLSALFHPTHHMVHIERGNFFAFRLLVEKR